MLFSTFDPIWLLKWLQNIFFYLLYTLLQCSWTFKVRVIYHVSTSLSLRTALAPITNETRSRASRTLTCVNVFPVLRRDAGERRCTSTDKIGASPTALQVQSRQYKQSCERGGSAYVISRCATVRWTHHPRQTANVNSQRRSICFWLGERILPAARTGPSLDLLIVTVSLVIVSQRKKEKKKKKKVRLTNF